MAPFLGSSQMCVFLFFSLLCLLSLSYLSQILSFSPFLRLYFPLSCFFFYSIPLSSDYFPRFLSFLRSSYFILMFVARFIQNISLLSLSSFPLFGLSPISLFHVISPYFTFFLFFFSLLHSSPFLQIISTIPCRFPSVFITSLFFHLPSFLFSFFY